MRQTTRFGAGMPGPAWRLNPEAAPREAHDRFRAGLPRCARVKTSRRPKRRPPRQRRNRETSYQPPLTECVFHRHAQLSNYAGFREVHGADCELPREGTRIRLGTEPDPRRSLSDLPGVAGSWSQAAGPQNTHAGPTLYTRTHGNSSPNKTQQLATNTYTLISLIRHKYDLLSDLVGFFEAHRKQIVSQALCKPHRPLLALKSGRSARFHAHTACPGLRTKILEILQRRLNERLDHPVRTDTGGGRSCDLGEFENRLASRVAQIFRGCIPHFPFRKTARFGSVRPHDRWLNVPRIALHPRIAALHNGVLAFEDLKEKMVVIEQEAGNSVTRVIAP